MLGRNWSKVATQRLRDSYKHKNLDRKLLDTFRHASISTKTEEPPILDVLALVEHYDFSFYATTFDVNTLIANWRVPESTQDWLQKYRQKLEMTFSFEPWKSMAKYGKDW